MWCGGSSRPLRGAHSGCGALSHACARRQAPGSDAGGCHAAPSATSAWGPPGLPRSRPENQAQPLLVRELTSILSNQQTKATRNATRTLALPSTTAGHRRGPGVSTGKRPPRLAWTSSSPTPAPRLHVYRLAGRTPPVSHEPWGSPAEQPPSYRWRNEAPRDLTTAVNQPELPASSLAGLARGRRLRDTRESLSGTHATLASFRCPQSKTVTALVPWEHHPHPHTRRFSKKLGDSLPEPSLIHLCPPEPTRCPRTLDNSCPVRGRTEHKRSTADAVLCPAAWSLRKDDTGNRPVPGGCSGVCVCVRVASVRVRDLHSELLIPFRAHEAQRQSLTQVSEAGDQVGQSPCETASPTGACVRVCTGPAEAQDENRLLLREVFTTTPDGHLSRGGSGPEVCASGAGTVPRTTRRRGSGLPPPAPCPPLLPGTARWS
ncbi:uncharacterized protein WM277_006745 [Molossus nigricans]